MNSNDRVRFSELLAGLSEYYNQKPLGAMAVQVYFSALSDYDFDAITEAASRHVRDVKGGQYFPKAADLIRQIEGAGITTDRIIALARMKNTPLGILCRIQIGSHDLNNQTNMFYLAQRAEECLMLLPEWRRRALNGDYSAHELAIMAKHGVSPFEPFDGVTGRVSNPDRLLSRIESLRGNKRYIELSTPSEPVIYEKTDTMDSSVVEFLRLEMLKPTEQKGE